MTVHQEAYVAFLAHFHGTRDYFECHELLEEHWKKEPDPQLKEIWHGLIQVAVALYHQRRGNTAGALKMLEQAARRLKAARPELAGLGREELSALLDARLEELRSRGKETAVFHDMSLPVEDERLLQAAKERCSSWGHEWGRASPLTEEALVHRHKLRDRTGIIEERMSRLAAKEAVKPSRSEGEEA